MAAPVVATLDADDQSFGVLQDIVSLTQHVSVAEVQQKAQAVLNEKGKPRSDRSIEAPDVPMLRKYDQVRVTAGTLDGYFSVESITYDQTSGTMRIGLGNLQDSPVTGIFTLVDESAIPSDQPTGGSAGELLQGNVTDSQRYALALAAGWSGSDAIIAVAISLSEDPSGDPRALTSTSDYGLWQINLPTWGAKFGGQSALAEPLANAKAA